MIYVFIMITRGTVDMFNTAFGLYADTWAAWTEVILNVGITVATAFYLGINGILLGKIISTALIIVLWKPYTFFPGDCKLPTCCTGKKLFPFCLPLPFYTRLFILSANLFLRFSPTTVPHSVHGCPTQSASARLSRYVTAFCYYASARAQETCYAASPIN